MTRNGTPIQSIDVILSSLTDSSWKQYDSSLRKWWNFCNSSGYDALSPNVQTLLLFLQLSFESGAGYSSLGTARSAISLLSTSASSPLIGDNTLIVRFLKGVAKTRPPMAKYNSVWDPKPVLTYLGSLEPISDLSLHELALKLVGLLALATAQRVQTLCSIKVSDIYERDYGFEIFISSQLKTSKPGKEQPCLVLPKFVEHPEWCVFRTLKHYLECTKAFRVAESSQLLLSFNSPYRPVTTQTISRWIKTVLSNSGIDVSVFSAHSTRHVATSTAARYGVTLDQIRARAGWSTKSDVFARFYRRPIDDRQEFAQAVLNIS